jgi:hypothetical protein
MSDRQSAVTLIHDLMAWTQNPTHVDVLKHIVSGYDDTILAASVVACEDKNVSRILWCELALRRGLFDFTYELTETTGSPKLEIKAGGKAVTQPKLVGPS